MGVGGQSHKLAALPPGRGAGIHCTGARVSPQGRSWQMWKISPTPGFDPRTAQPVASRFTVYATLYLFQ
jgi:hypothetical protein